MSSSVSFHPAIDADSKSPLNLDMNSPFVPQVQGHLKDRQDLRGTTSVALTGQAVAGILQAAGLELAIGLPTITLVGFGDSGPEAVGELSLTDYRHNEVRSRRGKRGDGDAFAGYTVINASGRTLPDHQIEEIKSQVGSQDVRVLECNLGQADTAAPQKGVADALLGLGLTEADWTSGRVVLVPPGLGTLAVVVATAVHGLSEAWPQTARVNRHGDGSFHVDEIVDVQSMRQFGAGLVAGWDAEGAPVSVSRDLFNQVVEALGDDPLAAQLRDLIS